MEMEMRNSFCPDQMQMWSDLVGGRLQHQDAEDEKHSEPDLAQNCGVTLHFIQQAAQQVPFSHFSRWSAPWVRKLKCKGLHQGGNIHLEAFSFF